MAKIEEMECLLREAQAEKQRLLEHRVKHLAHIMLFHVAMYIIIHGLLFSKPRNALKRLRRPTFYYLFITLALLQLAALLICGPFPQTKAFVS